MARTTKKHRARMKGAFSEGMQTFTDLELDELNHAIHGGRGRWKTWIPTWYADKPHQVVYRLIAQLTRANARIAELEKELAKVRK